MIEDLMIIQTQTLDDYYKLYYRYTTDDNYTMIHCNGYYHNAIYCWADDSENNYYIYIFFDRGDIDYKEVLKDYLVQEPSSEKIIEETFSKLESVEYQDGYKEVKNND